MMKHDVYFVVVAATIVLLLTGCSGALPASSWPNATMVENKLVIANNNAVYAISSDDGRLIWQFPSKSDNTRSKLFASPAHINDSVMVTSDNKYIFAIDIKTGNEMWNFGATNNKSGTAPTGTSISSKLAFFTSGSTLYALHISTGETSWKFESGKELWAPPAAKHGHVYLPSMDHSLTSIEIESGSQSWKQELGGALADSPTIYEDTLYLGSLSNKAYAIDAASGRIKWEFETKGWVWGSPVVVSEQVFFSDLDGYVYALNRESGRQYWTSQQLDSASRGTPAYADGSIFVCTDNGFVYSIDANSGNQNWSIEVDIKNSDRLLADPIAHNGLVYVTSMNGDNLVHAIHQENGQIAWQFAPE